MENKRILYDFCPRCSGLMKDGVCISCGYERKCAKESPSGLQGQEEGAVLRKQEEPAIDRSVRPSKDGQKPSQRDGKEEPKRSARKKNTGIIIGFCIGAFLFLAILCLAIYLIVSDVKEDSSKTWRPLEGQAYEEEVCL